MKPVINNIKIALTIPIILIVAWMISHVMALFGIFAVAAYPIWVLFFPQNAVCLGCRNAGEGNKCYLCNQKVESEKLNPKNARSILLNTLMILFVTVLSLGVVYLENSVINSSGLIKSFKTVSFNIPDKSQYRVNEIFPMKIEISGIQTPINVVQADITFDPTILEVIEVSTKDSFASVFVQKDINNNLGYVRLTGGIPSPGYSSSTGTFGTIYFKTKRSGLVSVSFLPTSLVLADDGKGTNVLREFPTSSYVIKPEAITVEEEVTQRELFRRDVLGASETVLDPNICVISLEQSSFIDENILGITDGQITQSTEEGLNIESFFSNIWNGFVKAVHFVDTFILAAYQKVFQAIIPN